MILIPDDIRDRLLANGAARPGDDTMPVVKLFSPVGAATWLLTEMAADGDTMFGLADLGLGCPELGNVSLAEVEALRLPFGLRIERDLYFAPRFSLKVYAVAAHRIGRITEDERLLAWAAAWLRDPETPFPPPDDVSGGGG
jgi:hypothetical protein